MLRLNGPQAALESLMRWRPRSLAIRVASILATNLIASSDIPLLQRCLTEAHVPSPWDLFLRIRISAAEKMTALIGFAHLLLPISPFDAQQVFELAIDIASEINEEAIHEIKVLSSIAQHANRSMTSDGRRSVACSLAQVISDAGIRLDGNEHFPWEAAAQTLATLDTPIALAATSRWEDADLVHRETMLPSVIFTALASHALMATHVAACSPLLDDLQVSSIEQIVEEALCQQVSCNAMELRTLMRCS